MKFGSLFSGFGGADIGARAAGLDLAWGVEYVPEIAAVANANLGEHVLVADILDLDPATFDPVDVLHASPPCPNFSVAKAGGEETPHDLAMAQKVAEFVVTLRPPVFTLENVWGYRNSQSWAVIRDALYGAGYWLNMEHVNAADFGVPQTRKRMIVRAVLGGWVPYLPAPVPWIGWYAAIEDLLPTLPESKLAPWQLARLPEDLRASVLFSSNGNYESFGDHHADAGDPAATLRTDSGGRLQRAVLMGGANTSGEQAASGVGVSDEDDPARTVAGNSYQWDAVLFKSESTAGQSGIVVCGKDDPAFTIRATRAEVHWAQLGARVVAMTPRCLARFQSFPDWYELPTKKTLAARGIGNAVPPLLYQRIIEGLI